MNKNRKTIKRALVLALLVTLCVTIGCLALDKHNKEVAQATAFDNVKVTYKSDYQDGNIAKTPEEDNVDTTTLISVMKNGKVDHDTKITDVDVKTIDTSVEGNYSVTYTVTTNDTFNNQATKTYKKTFVVSSNDTVAPVIKFKEKTVTITAGDEYNPKDNIKSVKDEFDGDVAYSKEATEGAYYTIDDSKLDTSKKGTYKVVVKAVDSSKNETSKTFKVKVKKASSSSTTSSSSSSNSSSSKSNTNTSKNNSSSSKATTSNSYKSNSSSSSTSSNKNTTSSGSSSNSNNSSSTQKQQTCSQVWVDTSHYEDVTTTKQEYVQPVQEQVSVVVCNGCGAEFSTYAEYESHAGALRQAGDTSHSSHHSKTYYNTIQEGYWKDVPVTTQQWVSSGYYETRCS